MANESQYINPIIQAMANSAARQGQVEQNQLEYQRLASEQKLREQQLKQQEQQIENEHEYHTGFLDIQGKLREAQAEANRIEAIKNLRDLSVQGTPQSTIQSLQGKLPSLQGVDLSNLPTAASEAQRVRGLASAQAGGAAEGALPSQLIAQDNQAHNAKDLKQMEIASQEKLAGQKITSEEKTATLGRDTQKWIAQLETNAQLYRTGLEYGGTPETNKAMQLGIARGDFTPSMANPLERANALSVINSGGRLLKPQDTQVLQQIGKIEPLFDRLQAFADKYLPSEKKLGSLGATAAATAQAHGLGFAAGLSIPTDAQNELANINTQALNVGRAIEGVTGRPLAAQMELTLHGLTSGGITKEQAESRIQNLKSLTDNEQNMIQGGMAPEQQNLLYQRFGVKPLWLKSAPKIHPSNPNAILDEEESLRQGKPQYEVKGGQKPSPLGGTSAGPQ